MYFDHEINVICAVPQLGNTAEVYAVGKGASDIAELLERNAVTVDALTEVMRGLSI